MERRIYGVPTDINEQQVCNFYNKRATRFSELGDTTVLLGDSNPDAAVAHNKFEREVILPKLGLSSESRFLDIGCGTGRIAEAVIPLAGYYCGTDLTTGIVEVAKSQCVFPNRQYDFHNLSFAETVDRSAESYGGTFNTIFSSGVFMYINDEELCGELNKLLKLMDDTCICYFENTVAIHERLTLNEFPSDALKDNYSAIYRTREEYAELYRPLIDAGFVVAEEQLIAASGNYGNLSETERWYIILKRIK